ncbi:MAG: DUF192 domain-containing protein [Halodesulfurarchaeum sp.]
MQVVHVDTDRVLAEDVELADTFVKKLKGVMFRPSLPPDYGLVFPFESVERRGVHMLFVRVAIDVLWLEDGTVQAVETLEPWTGFARAPAKTIVELPAGVASAVSPGDTVEIRS